MIKLSVTNKTTIVICIFFLVLSSTKLCAQSGMIESINERAISLSTISPEANYQDLARLKGLWENHRIFGLGEATHGTKEFFLFKHRLMRFLVTEMQVKTFVIEADFSGAMVVNDYILHAKGEPYDAISALKMPIWINKEFLDMVIWMKDYNLTQVEENKIRFYGCDMQTPSIIANLLLKGTIKTLQPLSSNCKEGLQFLFYSKDKKNLKEDIDLLTKTSLELQEMKVLEENDSKRELLQQAIKTIIQWISVRLNEKQSGDIRDRSMAENCEWIYNHEKNNKMVVWAHNLHVCKNITVANSRPMGNYLKDKFNDDYYALGFAFNSGTLRAGDISNRYLPRVFDIPEVKQKESADYILSLCKPSNFILDFSNSSDMPDLNKFLNQSLFLKTMGWAYSPHARYVGKNLKEPLISLYDGLVFIRITTAASPQLTKRNND